MHDFETARARHLQAVAEYAAAAALVPESQWKAPRAPGKWSPAEITLHLTLAFRAFEQEMDNGLAMKMRLSGWKYFYARWVIMRGILADKTFPTGAPAPRETRPAGTLFEQADGLEQFRTAAEACDTRIVSAHASRPGLKLTHPYFGRVALTQALFISAKHIEHHRLQLSPQLQTVS